MAVDLNTLSDAPFNDNVDVAHLPAQMGASEPPPQPGPFVFRLPPTLGLAQMDDIPAEQTKGEGPRLRVKFDDQAPLVIVQAHLAKKDRINTPFKTSVTNTPRKRGKKDDPNAPKASDWDYLNQGLGHTTRPQGNKGYTLQIIADAQAGKTFGADLEWSWSCNPNRAARFPDGQGGSSEVESAPGVKKMGCGERAYQDDIDKVNGAFPLTVTCNCGAQVRAFANLARFRPVVTA